MLCLSGFELYSRWVPLNNVCTDRILTNGLFLKDETKNITAANRPFRQKEDQTKQKYFNVHIFAPEAVILSN